MHNVKNKSNHSLRKRFKVTASGKLLRMRQGRRHIMTKKSGDKSRFLSKPTEVTGRFAKIFGRMIRGL